MPRPRSYSGTRDESFLFLQDDNFRKVQAGTYCTIELGQTVNVQKKSLFVESGGWLYWDNLVAATKT
jgi:hypothetical protein